MPVEGNDIAIIDPETSEECRVPASTTTGLILNLAEAVGEIVGRNTLPSFEGYYNNSEADAGADARRLVLVGGPRISR